MSILAVAVLVLWILVLAMGILVIALARQIGVLHERSAPMGALMVDRGPDVGGRLPVMDVVTIAGTPLSLGAPTPRPRLLLFVGANCPVCKKMLPVARDVAIRERLELVLIGDEDASALNAMVARHGLQDLAIVNDAVPGLRLSIGKLPYSYLLAEDGTVASKGLVNTREHLESLVVAKEIGVGSAQQYLTMHHQRSVA